MGSFWQNCKMIKSVEKIILAIIFCKLIRTNGSPLHSNLINLNSEPGQPYIVNIKEIDFKQMKEGEELQCVSQGGKPPAEIQWWDGEGRRIVSDATEHVMRMEDRKTFKTVSTLKIKASKYQLITCSAHNDVFPAGRMSKTVQIGTEDQVVVETKELEEGDSVEIICQKQQNDRSVKFKWLINDAEIFDEEKNILELQQFSKSFDNSHIKCLIEDSMGQFNVVRVIKLVYKTKARGNESKHPQPVLNNLLENSISQRSKKRIGKSVTKKKTMLSCEMNDDNAEEPDYVYMDASMKDLNPNYLVEVSHKNKKYKCRIIENGIEKINKMSKDMTSITKSMNHISKSLNEINSFTRGSPSIPF